MTPRQIELIQETFQRAVRIGPHFTATFYRELFAMEPAAKAMFRGDMIVQGEHLMRALGHVADAIADLDSVLPALREMAVRHIAYGVEARHYPIVGTALLRTFRHELGADFSSEARAAWAAAYEAMAAAMCEAAYGRGVARAR